MIVAGAQAVGSTASSELRIEINGAVAHPARVYDYLLGGADNFRADRRAAEEAFAHFPGAHEAARSSMQANRLFLERVVRHVVAGGVRQILDIGAGIPTRPHRQVHQIAQLCVPETRVVYVDNDPVVQAHAHQLCSTSTRSGAVRYFHGDLRDSEAVLERAAGTLDLDRPVAVLLGLVLDFLTDDEDPHGIVCRLLDPLADGSYLAISHLAGDLQPDRMALVADRLTGAMRPIRTGLTVRTYDDVTRFFDGVELVEPGVVRVGAWRAEPDDRSPDHVYGGLGRKSCLPARRPAPAWDAPHDRSRPRVNTRRNRP